MSAARLWALICAALLLVGTLSVPAAAVPPRFSVLVFSKTTFFRHDSIPAANAAIKQLGEQNNFATDFTEDAGVFNDVNLARYQAIVFNNTDSTPQSGNLLNDQQRAAFQRYIEHGGGWTGIHAATASERDWKWYEGLAGAIFDFHPVIQPGRAKVLDHVHPSTKDLPDLWELQGEEWYNWKANPTGRVHTLLQVKMRDGIQGITQDVDHPISWCQNYDGGRSWYTMIGHGSERYSDPVYLKHLLGGIQWSAGAVAGDCSPTKDGMFQRIPLVTDSASDLAVAPDRRVFYIQRSGQLKIVNQDTLHVSTALDLGRSSLLGLALDNDFAHNHWVYLTHSDGKQAILSRFTITGDTADPASAKRLLEIPVHSGVDVAGSIAFDKHGNLFVATGDNTDPSRSDGFSPLDERPGNQSLDAQATAANTDDLRGKILRITPQPDGTYTIPAGNLFPPATGQTRPEIYTMGQRDPVRITVDPATDALMVADLGPSARAADPNRGPQGTAELSRITHAGNQGWPYCVGDNIPYNSYDFATGTSGPKFDCAHPVNDSPNNTGLRNLPPAEPATVWYGSSASAEFPEMGTGGVGPMSGPVYAYDPANPLVTKFPRYFDGKWFTAESARRNFKVFSLQRTDQTFADPRFAPVKAGDLQSINGIFVDMSWVQPVSAHFGPDGSLYVIDSGIYRIDYMPNGHRPTAEATASADSGRYPLTVNFSGAGTSGDDYAWDFDGNGTVDSTEANPTHVYMTPGQFDARLTVTSRSTGLTGVAVTTITPGNTRPDVQIVSPQAFFDAGGTLPFEVHVTDREDGRIDCSKVVVRVQLGQDVLDSQTGCFGTVTIGPNSPVVMSAQYTDGGGPRGVPALTGSASVTLQPRG